MRALAKFLTFIVVLALVAAAGAWVWASRQSGPTITIRQPEKFIGQTTALELTVEAPRGQFSRIDVGIEQKGQTLPVFALAQPADAEVKQDSAERIYVMRPIGKRAIPNLEAGPARIVVNAARPVLWGMRQAESSATRDVQVRLEPPRIAVLSTHHYVNHGGAEFVVYRATPADIASGVRVGDREYPGFPGSAVGLQDASLRVAFFGLLHDQDLNTPVELFGRDEAGNVATAPIDRRPFPKPFRRSRIEIDDKFLGKVVPGILDNTPSLKVSDPSNLLASFLTINRELRKQNAAAIAALAAKTAPEVLWKGPFTQLSNSAVESSFADQRTYIYKGQEVDQQVHLGFDLASTASAPVQASNAGRVVLAEFLGIYGNCVILDHGMGLQSLYAHLSTIDVQPGQAVPQGHTLGRSGATGLAGGDHLHFTMLLGGHAITPVDWWSAQWVEDRVLRKFREAGATPAAAPTPTP
jgi:murein DD-endopeptidase MepM/ murein hydrolase activator NlpD